MCLSKLMWDLWCSLWGRIIFKKTTMCSNPYDLISTLGNVGNGPIQRDGVLSSCCYWTHLGIWVAANSCRKMGFKADSKGFGSCCIIREPTVPSWRTSTQQPISAQTPYPWVRPSLSGLSITDMQVLLNTNFALIFLTQALKGTQYSKILTTRRCVA